MGDSLFVVDCPRPVYRRAGITFAKGRNTIDISEMGQSQRDEIENDEVLEILGTPEDVEAADAERFKESEAVVAKRIKKANSGKKGAKPRKSAKVKK